MQFDSHALWHLWLMKHYYTENMNTLQVMDDHRQYEYATGDGWPPSLLTCTDRIRLKLADGLQHPSVDVDAFTTLTACCDLDLWPPEFNPVIVHIRGYRIFRASLVEIAKNRSWDTVVTRLSRKQTNKLDGCIVWNTHNTVFNSKRSAICAEAVYFQHSTRPSVTWLNYWWLLAACDSVMSALSAILSTCIRRRRKFGEVSCTECTGQRMTLNWLER